MDIAGQEQPARLGDGGHQLELGEVGAVVLAVPELHQAIVGEGVISTTGGGVESDSLDGQGIDVAVGVPEIGLQGLPSGLVVEALQEQGQAVVAELDGADSLSDEGFEGVLEFLGPGLDGGLAVVGSGEDVGDPDGDEPAVGESLVEGVCGEVSVEDLGELELDEEPQEQWDVIDAFVGEFEGGVHGGTPTRVWGKSSLYRGRRAGGMMQAKRREHGTYGEARSRRNS